ncbi:MAG TPA: NAD(P)-dependent oxidoreductase [Kineosporiaceae bacterium]|nr:NAD(P)-dependent oxidoreductase [Kineosporiaceae bacterium]
MGDGVGGHRVLVTTRSFGSGSIDVVGLLESTGVQVVRGSTVHDPVELITPLATADAWITGRAPVTAELLDLAPRLRVVTSFGVDADAVDVNAAVRRAIVVTNTPGADTDAVADHALGLLLAALRGVVDGDRRVRAGRWTITRGRELRAMTVGIVGFERVGRAVAKRLVGFGGTVAVHESFADPGQAAAAGLVSLPHAQFIADCDAVTLHAAGGLRILDADWLAGCRDAQIVVNVGHAGLVDETAVAVALRSGRLSAYAADSLRQRDPAEGAGPLLDSDLQPSVIVTPHLGSETLEAIDRMGLTAANDVIAVLAGHSPTHQIEPYEAPIGRFVR